MAKQPPVALVFAGPVSRGSLGQLPGLRHRLAWIKSSSVGTASRAVHALKAGRAVASFSDVRDASIFIVTMPERSVDRIVGELLESGLEWREKTVIFYDVPSGDAALDRLAAMGACTASVLYHPTPEQYLAQGHPEAIRHLRTLTGKKPLLTLRCPDQYGRGIQLTTEHFLSLFASAMEAFMEAGMPRAQAQNTTAAMINESARSWLRAGKRVLERIPKERR